MLFSDIAPYKKIYTSTKNFTAEAAYRQFNWRDRYRRINWRYVTGRSTGPLQDGYSRPNTAVAPTDGSSGGKCLLPVQTAVCFVGRGPCNKPPIHMAVADYRRVNRRLGEKFAKKNSIYF